MVTAVKVRSFDPIWVNFDLKGKLFDDSFYLFVLHNELPYLPATVWHDPSGTTPWTNPIRYLANGTLPVDIYWDPAIVYRLEFRKGPTQSDPLIYEVNNYTAGSGITPASLVAVNTDNQMANPQFADIEFSSPLTLTSVTNYTVAVGAGWELILTGTGSATISRIPLNSALPTPTNAPYALRIQITGGAFTEAVLRQRFQQNGNLWSGKFISTSITARSQTVGDAILAVLTNSQGVDIATVLPSTALTSDFVEYTATTATALPASTDTDLPPSAYLDYRLLLPLPTCDVYLTSFQLLATVDTTKYAYIQETVDRQIDHTFHSYRDSIVLQPKDSILTGWDFGLNPWQSNIKTGVTPATNLYTGADQTILIQQNYVQNNIGSNVSYSQANAANNLALTITAVTANNQFGLLQYIDPKTCAPYWLSKLSSLVRLKIATSHGSTVRFKMRLIASSTVPTTTTRTYPVASWVAGQDPTFDAAFTVLTPINDPIYTAGTSIENFSFDRFDLSQVTVSATTQTLGIFIYTIDNMNEAATADAMLFESVSLVPNDFAITANAKTFDETLRECEYYFEKTMDLDGPNALFVAGVFAGAITIPLTISSAREITTSPLYWQFRTVKRIAPNAASNLTVYAPSSNVIGSVDLIYYLAGTPNLSAQSLNGIWAQATSNEKYIQFISTSVAPFATIGAGANLFAYVQFQYKLDVRIGI